jgi:adenylate kinase
MQGAGKGTVGRLLAEQADVTHLSAGSLLRDHVRAKGSEYREIGALLEEGKSVDPSISYGLLGERVRGLDGNQILLLDAFPREASQLNLLEETVGSPPALAVHLAVPRPLAVERLRNRETCEECDATFGPDFPPRSVQTCDLCAGRLAQRTDDTEAAIGERLDGWARLGPPLLAAVAGITRLVDVDATHDVGSVTGDVRSFLRETP